MIIGSSLHNYQSALLLLLSSVCIQAYATAMNRRPTNPYSSEVHPPSNPNCILYSSNCCNGAAGLGNGTAT